MSRVPVASLYARLSRKAGENNLSLDGWVSEMTERCRREGWDPRYIHREDGVSGGKRVRDAMTDWLADATDGRADVLLAPSVDRITREGLNAAARILDVVEGKDPQTGKITHRPVRLVDMQGIDSDHGDSFRFQFVVRAEVARAERERIRDRARSRDRRLLQSGRARGSFAPYGYKIVDAPDGKGKTYAIAEEEAKLIHAMYERIMGGDQSVGRVTRWANTQPQRPRMAKEWTRTGVRKMLTGNAITGRVSSKGRLVRNEKGEPLQPFPAILTVAEHAAIAAKLATQPKEKRPSATKALHLLSGLLHCHSCAHPLVAARAARGDTYYRCQTRSAGGVCAGAVSVSRVLADKGIAELYLSVYGDEPMYRTRTVVEGVDDLAAIQEEIKDLMADMAREVTAKGVERLQRLQKEREEAEARPPRKRTFKEPTGQTVSEWWEDPRTHLDDKRDALRNAYGKITLHPGRSARGTLNMARLTFERSTEED